LSIIVKNHTVMCSDCNVRAKRLKEYYEDLYRDDPEYFWEPWDSSENYMYKCPKCKKEDFPS
jgi:hypothetical protein